MTQIEYDVEKYMDLHKACRIGDLNEIRLAYEAQPQKINEKDSGVFY